jgi:hypothetical protein
MARHRRGLPGRARGLSLGVALLIGLSGCGGPRDADDWAEDSGNAPAQATVTPRPGMIDVEAVTWWEHGALDDHTMLITYASQGPPCEVLDRVEVDQADERLTITLYQGRDPDADPDQPCDGPALVFDVEVPLSVPREPSGDIPVIDGASTQNRVEIEAILTPQPGLVDVQPVRWWYDFGHAGNDHTMLVTYASEGPPCEALDRVEVDESDTTVTITLFEGRDPDPDQPCDGRRKVVGVEVPLSRSYGPAGVSPYTQPGIAAETGEGPVINGGSLTAGP